MHSGFDAKDVPVDKNQRETLRLNDRIYANATTIPRLQSEDNMGGPERRVTDDSHPPDGTEMLESSQERIKKTLPHSKQSVMFYGTPQVGCTSVERGGGGLSRATLPRHEIFDQQSRTRQNDDIALAFFVLTVRGPATGTEHSSSYYLTIFLNKYTL